LSKQTLDFEEIRVISHPYTEFKASVEADTVQSALWCQWVATGSDEKGIKLMPVIRK
jgi:hypothetical protein